MPSRIYIICNSYESGFGHGYKNYGLDLSKTPHGDPGCAEAYQIGYEEGYDRYMQGRDAMTNTKKLERTICGIAEKLGITPPLHYKIGAYLNQLGPHQRVREGAQLLIKAQAALASQSPEIKSTEASK